MFWHAHYSWSRRYGLEDGGSTTLSLVLVFLALIFVHPLRMVFGSFCAWLSQMLPAADGVRRRRRTLAWRADARADRRRDVGQPAGSLVVVSCPRTWPVITAHSPNLSL